MKEQRVVVRKPKQFLLFQSLLHTSLSIVFITPRIVHSVSSCYAARHTFRKLAKRNIVFVLVASSTIDTLALHALNATSLPRSLTYKTFALAARAKLFGVHTLGARVCMAATATCIRCQQHTCSAVLWNNKALRMIVVVKVPLVAVTSWRDMATLDLTRTLVGSHVGRAGETHFHVGLNDVVFLKNCSHVHKILL